jgi:phosphoglycerate dehydrogenase-like enzyme
MANSSKKPKVVLDPLFRKVEWIFSGDEFRRLESLVDVVWGKNEPMPEEELEKVKKEVFAVITGRWRYGEVAEMENLRAIIEVGGSPPPVDALDYETCFQRGIRVLSCAPVFGPAVAELALGLALCSARGIVEADSRIRSGEEKYSRTGNADAFSLYGKKVGMIGFGGLARSLKPLLDPFRPDYLVYDPWLPDSFLSRYNLKSVDLETLLSESKLIFVLAISTPENKGLLNRERLGLIKEDSILLVISRAHLVDFDALVDMVNEGRFRAAVDVYPEEPIPPDHPVRGTKGTILTPHIAGHVPEIYANLGPMIINDLEAMISGFPPRELQNVERELVNMFVGSKRYRK